MLGVPAAAGRARVNDNAIRVICILIRPSDLSRCVSGCDEGGRGAASWGSKPSLSLSPASPLSTPPRHPPKHKH